MVLWCAVVTAPRRYLCLAAGLRDTLARNCCFAEFSEIGMRNSIAGSAGGDGDQFVYSTNAMAGRGWRRARCGPDNNGVEHLKETHHRKPDTTLAVVLLNGRPSCMTLLSA